MAYSRINEQIIRNIMTEMNSKSSQNDSETDEGNDFGSAHSEEKLEQINNTDRQSLILPSSLLSSPSSSATEEAGTTTDGKNTTILSSKMFSKGMYKY